MSLFDLVNSNYFEGHQRLHHVENGTEVEGNENENAQQ